MGCGSSRLAGAGSARADEGGVVPLPAGIRPLLRRRLEEMKKRSHASVLRGRHTLSKKELLPHGSSEDGEETEENDGSFKSSAKVAPAPDHHVEENKEVIYEKVLTRDDVKEEEEVLKKQGKDTHHDVMDNMTINVKKEEVDDEEERMTNLEERMICPGSPSFRVYCINVASDPDEDEKKNGEEFHDTSKSVETESVTVEPKEEESIVKKEKTERKGKRFTMALPRKYLANVTAPCYAGGRCMGNTTTHSRLVQEKSSQ